MTNESHPDPCPRCGSKKVAFEFRDWFSDEPVPPSRESYGTWFVCSSCGHSWPDDLKESIYE